MQAVLSKSQHNKDQTEDIMTVASATSIRFQFYDLSVKMNSDSPAYTDFFKQMYARFNESGAPTDNELNIEIQTGSLFTIKQAALKINGRIQPIDGSEIVQGYIYEKILREIVSRIKSHLLIHAGAVTLNNHGLILAGDSCHGKTTLVLELVRRGFRFLSDEMAALGRVDNQLYPFPRSLRVRPQTLEITGFTEASESAAIWLDKLILDIEQIKPASMGSSAPITHIVILKDESLNSANSDRPIKNTLIVSHFDDKTIEAIRRLDGIIDVCPIKSGGRHLLQITKKRSHNADIRIETICKIFNIQIMDSIEQQDWKPTFKTTASLKPITKSEATRELLKKFQGGYQSEILQKEFNGSAIRLFAETSQIIAGAKCYQLQVGPLGDMADLVCKICGLVPKNTKSQETE